MIMVCIKKILLKTRQTSSRQHGADAIMMKNNGKHLLRIYQSKRFSQRRRAAKELFQSFFCLIWLFEMQKIFAV